MKVATFLHDNFVPHMPQATLTASLTAPGGSAPAPASAPDASAPDASAPHAAEPHAAAPDAKKDKSDANSVYTIETTSTSERTNVLHRSLRGRHVQLLGIGATIGSQLFVGIGKSLQYGPLNLLLGFIVWSIPILCITVSVAEYVTYLPITSPFVRLAGRCCDEALEVMTAWNFWFLCCSQIPFEVTTINSIIHFWRDDYSPAIPLVVQIVLYFIINVFGVAIYGEVEFWLSLGKVILAVGLIVFTFITMVGGNPQHDAFGFRYWRDPGPMAVFAAAGSLGRFQGFLQCLIKACFTFAGPEYVSIVAAETINPRKTVPLAYKQVFIRLTIFFIGGALCVGILCASNDPRLLEAIKFSKPGAGASPYIVAMQNLHISVLPDIVNVLLITAAFSAGNSYTYCLSRTLYGMALDGFAPKVLSATTKTGIPIYCVLISLCWAMISFLQLGEQAQQVLNWIINLITSCQLINFVVLCVVYLCFYRAMAAQGIDRRTLPFRGWWQPYTAIVGAVSAFVMTFVSTYTIFLPGEWSIKSFLFLYLMIFVDVIILVGYKVIWRTKMRKPEEADITTGLREVELHEELFYAQLREKSKLDEKGQVKRSWLDRVSTVLFGSEM